MASRLGGFAKVKYPYSSFFKSSVLNCWGSNSKVRHSPKLLGFSATIAVIGFGAQYFRTDSQEKSNHLHFNTGILEQNNTVKVHAATKEEEDKQVDCSENTSSKLLKNGISNHHHISLLNYMKLLGLITPVSCSGDAICEDYNSKPQTKPTSASSCCSEEKTKSEANDMSAKCEELVSKGSGTASQVKKPSNKSCNTISSSGCSSSGGGIDIEAMTSELGGLKQIDWVIESDLSHCHLLRQASQFNVDSVTRILTETASAYEDYHMEYRRLIKVMMDSLEDSRKVCGADLEVVDCKLILIRSKLDEMKNKIQELDMFMGSLEKLGFASAEVSFMAHAEYASVAMSERLHSMGLEVKRLRDETKEMERDMLELQSLIIVESGKSLK